jgi:NAD(P)-dependent dehydrogenase (short-subunit alcohol dehydrogenase family)
MKDKVAIITGATGALGCEVVRAFLNAGAKIVATYRSAEKLRQLQEHIGRSDFHAIAADVTVAAQVAAMAENVLAKFGRIDILVNCAGGFFGGVPIADTTEEQWQQMMDVNFKSAFLCSRAVWPVMMKQKSGRIINIGAKGGLQGTAGMSAYAASKAVLINFTQSLAAEGKAHNITANVVIPSIIDTPENRAAMPKSNFENWVTPESLARVILFLCSEEGKDISGASVPVFGKG